MATMKTSKPPQGFLFSIVNSLETVIQLGLKVAPTPNSNINISLVYNDHATVTPSESIISFTLPYEQKHWINFAIQVMNDKITVFHNCIKTHEFNITREPKELNFESASTFYLAQAGNMRNKFEVRVQYVHLCFLSSCHSVKESEHFSPRSEISTKRPANSCCLRFYLPGKTKQLPQRMISSQRAQSKNRSDKLNDNAEMWPKL